MDRSPIYDALSQRFDDIAALARRDERMRAAADALWDALSPHAVSWIGFYLSEPGSMVHADGRREDGMVLAPHRDKPACSPIGMHGACGQAFTNAHSLVVTDVANLGEGYVACDPRDLSEVVVVLREADGTPWGVLDADSFEHAAFNESDARSLAELMRRAKLDAGDPAGIVTV